MVPAETTDHIYSKTRGIKLPRVLFVSLFLLGQILHHLQHTLHVAVGIGASRMAPAGSIHNVGDMVIHQEAVILHLYIQADFNKSPAQMHIRV